MSNKQNTDKVVGTFLSIAVVIFLIWWLIFGLQRLSKIQTLNAKSSTLGIITNYDMNLINNNPNAKNYLLNRKTINDIIQTNKELDLEKERYEIYLNNLQWPYLYFTRNILLPKLNIRKNTYSDEINTSIIWPKFLEKNPYNQINLINKWSDFFKDVGDVSEFNDITDISVGKISESGWFFSIPITLSFISPSKRSFLLLIEKLSTTSNKINIALINEFVFNLREILREKKRDVFENFSYPQKIKENNNIDEKIWFIFYSRLFDENYNKWEFLDNDIIDEVIAKTANCNKKWTQQCYFLFREKYRTLPYLAYTVSMEWNDKVQSMKLFFQNMPPIIQINEFTFDIAKKQSNIWIWQQYEWKIDISILWTSISDEEVLQISKVLWKSCFQEDLELTADLALSKLDLYMATISNLTSEFATKWQELDNLKRLITDIQTKYIQLSNYDKIIKLFEIWRMLSDSSICSI